MWFVFVTTTHGCTRLGKARIKPWSLHPRVYLPMAGDRCRSANANSPYTGRFPHKVMQVGKPPMQVARLTGFPVLPKSSCVKMTHYKSAGKTTVLWFAHFPLQIITRSSIRVTGWLVKDVSRPAEEPSEMRMSGRFTKPRITGMTTETETCNQIVQNAFVHNSELRTFNVIV